MSNLLKKESSLYLQQHAENPVNWYPWGTEAWKKAKEENKLVLVSIGYSSCHWCHVMEHETFEDEGTAAIMNKYFICIKVDREERPDIDQVYMTAVQLMTGSGGWPLNCFTLPDGRPIYGGTYFPNVTWKDLLAKLENFYRNDPDKAYEYAEELTKGLSLGDRFELKTDLPEKGLLPKLVGNWSKLFDPVYGGPNRAPKFPLPNNYDFLLRYSIHAKDAAIEKHVKLTLKQMAYGGIYDQIGGGFARYSTDTMWKVPHFEKMLYDNAQLISLYSKGYKAFRDPLYKDIVYETLEFLYSEMSDKNGSYYSAFDADSEGVEGKYYVWTEKELTSIALPEIPGKDSFTILKDYYNLNRKGYWEHDNYILLRHDDDEIIAGKHGIELNDLQEFIARVKKVLLNERQKRIAPGLDKKIVVSWNALLITGLCDAYEAFEDELFLIRAKSCAEALLSNAVSEKGLLLHLPDQKDKLNAGFLEDYAFTITALIRMYECTFDESYLNKALSFANDAIQYFYDEKNGFFYFNSTLDEELITRKKELHDNVIPSSNSETAKGLFLLARYFDETKFEEMASSMVSTLIQQIIAYGSSFSNWATLYMHMTETFKEIVIEGTDAMDMKKQIAGNYFPGVLFAGGIASSEIPLRKGRFVEGKTLVYVCENKSCQLPVETVKEAIQLIN
jgi:uncharacterized protein